MTSFIHPLNAITFINDVRLTFTTYSIMTSYEILLSLGDDLKENKTDLRCPNLIEVSYFNQFRRPRYISEV